MKQIDERLRGEYSQLTPQEQRVADFIFDHFDDLISYNSAELARLSGVSKATVSRLFKRLGYPSYRAMRDELRTLRQSGMPLTDNRDAVQGNTLLARHYKQEMANLTQWVNHIDAGQFNAVIAALVQARRVVLMGFRNSYPIAMHLRQQLMQVREQVLLMPQPGQTLERRAGRFGPRGRGGSCGFSPPAASVAGLADAVADSAGSDAAGVRTAGAVADPTGELASGGTAG